MIQSITKLQLTLAGLFVALTYVYSYATAAGLDQDTIKTVSRDGSVTYSDQPIEGPVRSVTTLPRVPRQAHSAIEVIPTPNAAAAGKPPSTDDLSRAKDLEIENRELCSTLKKNLAALSHGKVVRFDEIGERHYLTSLQISSEKSKVITSIKTKCN